MKNRMISVVLTLVLILGAGATFIYGVDIDKVRNEKSQVQNKLKTAETELKEQQKELDKINAELDKKQAEYDSTNLEYEKAKKEVQDIKVSVEEKKNNLGERLRTMYKNGSIGFVDVVLDSEGVSELLSNINFVQKIYKEDQAALRQVKTEENRLKKKESELAAVKGELEKAKAEIEKKQQQVEDKRDEMKKNRDVLQDHFNELQAQEDRYQAELIAWQKKQEEERAKAQAEQNNNQATGGDTVNPNPGNSGNGGTNPGGMIWPTTCRFVTAEYGYRPCFGDFHLGIDISGGNAYGQPVYAAKSGTVVPVNHHWSYGNAVTLYHGGGLATRYAHMSAVYVSAGQQVSQGQVIGRIGSTGNSTGPHLHFEVRVNGQTVNPRGYI